MIMIIVERKASLYGLPFERLVRGGRLDNQSAKAGDNDYCRDGAANNQTT